jgi:hypothetical protein
VTLSQKPFTKIELVEWLYVKVMSSSPSKEKKKKDQGTNYHINLKTSSSICCILTSTSCARNKALEPGGQFQKATVSKQGQESTAAF